MTEAFQGVAYRIWNRVQDANIEHFSLQLGLLPVL